MNGTLFIVATPIGNLDDLSARARETLSAVAVVAAEDTRHTRRLLMHIGAKPRLIALHDHNESEVLEQVLAVLRGGENVALVSDAGTPLVSDPGYRLVNAAHGEGLPVAPVPGPSAVIAALSAAGLPTDRFCFEGFVPSKAAARRAWLKNLAAERRTLVLFESVHRIRDCLADLVDLFGMSRPAFVGREISKLHEQCLQGTLGSLLAGLDDGSIVSKGEFVLVIGGASADTAPPLDVDRLLLALSEVLSARDAARVAASASGGKRNAMYARLLQLVPGARGSEEV